MSVVQHITWCAGGVLYRWRVTWLFDQSWGLCLWSYVGGSAYYGMCYTRSLALACYLAFSSTCAKQPTPPHFFLSRCTIQNEKYQFRFQLWAPLREKKEETIARLWYTRYISVGVVLIRPGCIVYPSYSPSPPDTTSHTSLSFVQAHLHAQLKLSHHVWPVPNKDLRTRSSSAPVFLLLSSSAWLSIGQWSNR